MSLSDIIKIPLAVLGGLLIAVLYYEGLRLPLIGSVIGGAVDLRIAAATEGLVALAEKTALEAKVAEAERQRAAAVAAADADRARADAAEREAQDASSKLEAAITADTGDDGCRVDDGDLDWLRRQSGGAAQGGR